MNENILLLIELGGLLLVGAGTILTIVAFALRLGRQLGAIQMSSNAVSRTMTAYAQDNAKDHKAIRDEIKTGWKEITDDCAAIDQRVKKVEDRVDHVEQRVGKLEEERAL